MFSRKTINSSSKNFIFLIVVDIAVVGRSEQLDEECFSSKKFTQPRCTNFSFFSIVLLSSLHRCCAFIVLSIGRSLHSLRAIDTTYVDGNDDPECNARQMWVVLSSMCDLHTHTYITCDARKCTFSSFLRVYPNRPDVICHPLMFKFYWMSLCAMLFLWIFCWCFACSSPL